MVEKPFKLTRSDGCVLGDFDRMDQAKRAAQDDAAERGYSLKWLVCQGGELGSPSTRGNGVFSYEVEELEG